MTTAEPIHPGEHLAEIMDELGISQYRLAQTIGVPPTRINDIVHCRRSITAGTALRIGKALGMTPDFWLSLQRMYDLDKAKCDHRRQRYRAPLWKWLFDPLGWRGSPTSQQGLGYGHRTCSTPARLRLEVESARDANLIVVLGGRPF